MALIVRSLEAMPQKAAQPLNAQAFTCPFQASLAPMLKVFVM